jgi:dTDP-4-dehydrorhamnose 3,5-epimerase
MEVKKTDFPNVLEITPRRFIDPRGFFSVTYDERAFSQAGLSTSFVQDNESFSVKGTLRGLHFQNPPHAQGKLVRVIRGRVQDVIVDLRVGSPTFKQWKSFIIDDLGKMLYVPEGFAHGFLALEDTIFAYKCTGLYEKEAENGVRWDDPDLNISWDLDGITPTVSNKDKELLPLKEVLEELATLQPGPGGHSVSCTHGQDSSWGHVCFCGAHQFTYSD